MIRGLVIREARPEDGAGIHALGEAAFGNAAEALLVGALRGDDAVLELVATQEGQLVGHVFFSRLFIEGEGGSYAAVALAPISVAPERQRSGIGSALIDNAHGLLQARGEVLSIVLGDTAYYGRFGYTAERAAGFASDYAGPYLQALAWGEAPTDGRLRYAPAFAGL